MRTAGKQATEDSAAVISPSAAHKQPPTPNVVGAHGHPQAASYSAASSAGGCHMDGDPKIYILYSSESDPPTELKSFANLGRKAVGAETTTDKPPGSVKKTLQRERSGFSDESEE